MVGDPLQPAPDSMEIRWFLYAEDAFWQGRFLLPQERIHALLKQGYWNPEEKKQETYDDLAVSVLPTGGVVVWLRGRNWVFIGRYQAQRIEYDYARHRPRVDRAADVRDTRAQMSPEVQQEIKTGTLSAKKWDEYLRRYRWQFEFSQPVTLADFGLSLLSAERLSMAPTPDFAAYAHQVMLTPTEKAVPQSAMLYLTGAYGRRRLLKIKPFDEAETQAAFQTLHAQFPAEPLKLHVELNQDLTTAVLSLRAGSKILPLIKTKVQFFDWQRLSCPFFIACNCIIFNFILMAASGYEHLMNSPQTAIGKGKVGEPPPAPAGKEGVTIKLSMFFDGTLNNRSNTEKRLSQPSFLSLKGNESSYANFYSNVPILEYMNLRNEADNHEVSVYIEGIGTVNFSEEFKSRGVADKDNGNDERQGFAFGSGPTGIRDKVIKGINEAKARILKAYEAKTGYVQKIVIDVFGFSRGAAARHFVHRHQALREPWLHQGAPELVVNFVGLSETVSSFEEGGSNLAGALANGVRGKTEGIFDDVKQLGLNLGGTPNKVIHLRGRRRVPGKFHWPPSTPRSTRARACNWRCPACTPTWAVVMPSRRRRKYGASAAPPKSSSLLRAAGTSSIDFGRYARPVRPNFPVITCRRAACASP